MFDVLTVCAGPDLKNIQLCLKGLRENLDFGKLFIVTNEPGLVPKLDEVVVIDEKEIIGTECAEELKKFNAPFFPKRFGWYYQQFLKMGFVRSKYCRGDYLIWDADTILLQPLDFEVDDKVIYTQGCESLNQHYIDTYKKILPYEFYLEKSMISQHLFVKKNVMLSLLDVIEARTSDTFFNGIVKNLTGNSPSLFSEYETYINYHLAFEEDKVSFRTVRWFRHAAAICGFSPSYRTLKKVFNDAKYVALEKFDLTAKGRLKSYIRFFIYKFKL